MRDSQSTSDASPMSDLVTRYIMGDIRETHWSRFMDILDSNTLKGADREAFAAFFSDCLNEIGDGDIFLPIVTEAQDVAGSGRKAA